jgi:hypothetical protein
MRKTKKRTTSRSKTKTKRNNKFSRRKYKTRKQRGGINEDNDYTLVGFFTRNAGPNSLKNTIGVPIFLPNNKEEFDILRISPFGAGLNLGDNNGVDPVFFFAHLFLPQLYKFKNRGLELPLFLAKGIEFYYENEVPVINYNRGEYPIPPPNYSIRSQKKLILPDSERVRITQFINKHKDEIKQMELKYPGLFQRIFITPEEEEEALREIERKEQEKLAAAKKPEKVAEAEAATSTNLSEEEEKEKEKEKIYQEEMEATNQMIPYLRAEEKSKKGSKISKKKYYNTYFTQDY